MPYIKPDQRKLFEDQIDSLAHLVGPPGELNYIITTLIHYYLRYGGLSYASINEVIGVLNCVQASLIETVYVPYEKTKIKENGNISGLDEDYAKKL